MTGRSAPVDRTVPVGRTGRLGPLALLWRSVALVALLASTWLVVGAALGGADTAVVSAGRTVFTVIGLFVLTSIGSRRRATTIGGSTRQSSRPYRRGQLVALAASGVTVYTVFSTLAIALAGPVLPTLVIALTPAVVLVAEAVLARTRPSAVTIGGTALAVLGAVVFIVPRLRGSIGHDVVLGALSAVVAMLSMAFYGIAFARVNRDHHGPMAPRILPVFALGSVPLVVWAVVAVASGSTLRWSTVGLLALLGIVIYVPVYLLQHRILVSAGATYASLLGLGVPPLVGVASAAVHLAAVPAPVQIAGMAATLVGTGVVIGRRLVGQRRAGTLGG